MADKIEFNVIRHILMTENLMKINTSELASLIPNDRKHLKIEQDYGTSLNYDLEIEPEEFLTFAEKDFLCKEKHGFINALSNCKRAIDCQIEKIFRCFGLPEKKNFPEKLETIQSMGIVAPKILQKVVRKRNYLEHKYVMPVREEVEDGIGVAELFIEASNKVLELFWSYYIEDTKKRIQNNGYLHNCIYVKFNEKKRVFELEGHKEKYWGTAFVNQKHKAFIPTIRLAIAVDKKRKVNEAFEDFYKALNK